MADFLFRSFEIIQEIPREEFLLYVTTKGLSLNKANRITIWNYRYEFRIPQLIRKLKWKLYKDGSIFLTVRICAYTFMIQNFTISPLV